MSNGCGCESGWLKWFRPPYARFFYVACCMHDDDYDRGGAKADRKKADRLLFARCLLTVSRSMDDLRPLKALWLVVVAYMYYVCVRACGWRYFSRLKD